MPPEAAGEIMTGVVRLVRPTFVRALVEYGHSGERMLCDLPRSLWRNGAEPEACQRFRLSWLRGARAPSLEVLNGEPWPRLRFAGSVFTREAAELLGFRARDHVLLVVGPNPLRPDTARYFLINAGWGELLALTRLHRLTTSLGIDPCHVDTAICDVRAQEFDPSRYAGHHIIFLGSVKSNLILRQHYWDRWPELCATYQFPEEPHLVLRVSEHGRVARDYQYADNLLGGGAGAGPDWEGMWVRDHFLLARVPNPYATDPHYQCILSCGTGTIATGYGTVALTARRSVRALLDRTEGKGFHLVGVVEMTGFYNPRRDPVRLLRCGREECDETILTHALASPAVWDPTDVYTEEDREEAESTYRAILERDPQ